MDKGDVDQDGDIDLLLGNFLFLRRDLEIDIKNNELLLIENTIK